MSGLQDLAYLLTRRCRVKDSLIPLFKLGYDLYPWFH
jgi:hypothetical protein